MQKTVVPPGRRGLKTAGGRPDGGGLLADVEAAIAARDGELEKLQATIGQLVVKPGFLGKASGSVSAARDDRAAALGAGDCRTACRSNAASGSSMRSGRGGRGARYRRPDIVNTDQGRQCTSHRCTELLLRAGVPIPWNGGIRRLDPVRVFRPFTERLLWLSSKDGCVYLDMFAADTEARVGMTERLTNDSAEPSHGARDGGSPTVARSGRKGIGLAP